MLNLLVARHGNTFDKGDVVLRVGRGTDLPLSTSGIVQAEKLGDFLKQRHPNLKQIFVSNLKRTQETAEYASKTMGIKTEPTAMDIFDEIDYGPDEGKPEEEVITRIGQVALNNWDVNAIPPPGWQVDPNKIIRQWQDFVKSLTKNHEDETILVITSNGIARFSYHILSNPEIFKTSQSLKLATGAISCFSYACGKWDCAYWNERP